MKREKSYAKPFRRAMTQTARAKAGCRRCRGKPELPETPVLRLNPWAFYRAEGTEYATVAGVGAQQVLAVAALVVELASVSRHGFLLGESTVWGRTSSRVTSRHLRNQLTKREKVVRQDLD